MGNNEPAVDQSDFRIRDSYGLKQFIPCVLFQISESANYHSVLCCGRYASLQYMQATIVYVNKCMIIP